MTDARIRPATAGDLDAIAAVAIATGQNEEWAGADPAYVRHLLAHGRVVVAERGGTVEGFGATRLIGSGPNAISVLCDLFVHPSAHGGGLGRAMLDRLWAKRGERRMTFSSLHAHALPLYTSFGLDAWWPLLYLSGDVRALTRPPGWSVRLAPPNLVSELERQWTGTDRAADYLAWAARPAGRAIVARHGDREIAAGVAAGPGAEFGIVHLALASGLADQEAHDAVLAALTSLEPPGGAGTARISLPAPHPATESLFAAGWRCAEFDVFMATEPGLTDARRAVPSPALA